jgi:hypothetical protein
MIIDYTSGNIINIELIDNINVIFKNIDNNMVQISFNKLNMDNIIIFDLTANIQLKHYQNYFYINRCNEYNIKINGILTYIIKPVIQQEIIKII